MRFRFWLGFLLAATIAVGALVAALVVRDNETDAFERNQQQETLRAAQQARALASLSIGQLASATAFFQVEEKLNQREFELMAESLLESNTLSAAAFIESVRAAERRAFERQRGIVIQDRSAGGDFSRAKERPLYMPLSFAATASDIDTTFPLGYDFGADRFRSRYLRQARDSGMPAATRVIRLSVGGFGVNVFRPVYREGAPTRTVAQRRAALIGFASGAFQSADFGRAVADSLPDDFEAQVVEEGRTVIGEPVPREESSTAPIRIADRTWSLVVRDPERPSLTLAILMAVLGLSIAFLLTALVLIWSRSERMHELALQASQDPLTGLKNRRRFEEELRAELARASRQQSEGALMIIDVDDLKLVNDTQGHPAGDRVLRRMADVLRHRARETDILAKIGGDEFAVVLPHCSMEEAEEVAGAISAAISDHLSEQEAPAVTASIGIAMFGERGRADFESVQTHADAAMYEAKQAGRSQIRVAERDLESA